MVYTFACTVASFIDDDWNLIERVVDFKPLAEKEHEGLYGGLAFINGARERGGLNKMSRFLTLRVPTAVLPRAVFTLLVSQLTMQV